MTSAMRITYDAHSDVLTLTQDDNARTEHGFESPAAGIDCSQLPGDVIEITRRGSLVRDLSKRLQCTYRCLRVGRTAMTKMRSRR